MKYESPLVIILKEDDVQNLAIACLCIAPQPDDFG